MKQEIIDARGLPCPVPVVKTLNAIGELSGGGVVETHVDNEVAVQNLVHMAKNRGFQVVQKTQGESHFVVRIEVPKDVLGGGSEGVNPDANQDADQDKKENFSAYTCTGPSERTVIVCASEYMGKGSDELGAILMKGFLYSITQLKQKPEAIIFYNSGVRLAVEGSQLEDLKKLEDSGVEIMSCGTCLDYYHIKEDLAVGSVSNMYAIVEKIAAATKVLYP